MSAQTPNKYTDSFFSDLADSSYHSALKILNVVFSVTAPASVIDFGCGTGSWLKAAHEIGAKRVVGVDGPWVSQSQLVDTAIELFTADMSASSTPKISLGSFDLAMSLECGEHLPESQADRLVENMCASSTKVLFGAAIPGQGGTDHINEQWQSYWAAKFLKHDYLPIDLVRPYVYADDTIPTWYRNNVLLYVRKDEYGDVLAAALKNADRPLLMTDLVIPQVFANPGLRHSIEIAKKIPGKVVQAIAWRAKIHRWKI